MTTTPESECNDGEGAPLLGGRRCSRGSDTNAEGAIAESDLKLATRVAATMFSFLTLGLFNSSLGPILWMIQHDYGLTDLHLSLLFLASPLGYIVAAQTSDSIHARFGQRGIALVGPLLKIIANGVIATGPPFTVVKLGFMIQGLGTGLLDGSWCAWAASLQRANIISGLLHGSYSIGGAIGPQICEFVWSRFARWNTWYLVLMSASILELITLVTTFRYQTASQYRRSKQAMLAAVEVDTRAMFRYRATWICAAYFLAYVGTETATTGWLVTFMLRKRGANLFLASWAASAFGTGMAAGRLILGFVTDRLGLRRATSLYFVVAVAAEALFIVVQDAKASIAIMCVLGFIMGPFFPSGVVLLTQLLPGPLHVAAVSFVASLGQVGGALIPFGIGALVQFFGIDVYAYAGLVLTLLSFVTWIAFSRLQPAGAAVDVGDHEIIS